MFLCYFCPSRLLSTSVWPWQIVEVKFNLEALLQRIKMLSVKPLLNSCVKQVQLFLQHLNCCCRHKDLGLLMTTDLSWSDHIALILGKAYKTLGLICRTFSGSKSISTKRSLYISLVRSHLVYGSQLWRPILSKEMKLEQLQRRATKFISRWTTSHG